MTWTKLGDEFGDEARDLTDAEFRTHIEALVWSNRRLLDLYIPKRDLRRFAETADPAAAAEGLERKSWWLDAGEAWYVGMRFPEWQLESVVVDHRRSAAALRQRRHRMHEAGDHSICLPGNCKSVTRDGTRDPGRVGTGRGSSKEVQVLAEPIDSIAAERGARENEVRAKEVLSAASDEVDGKRSPPTAPTSPRPGDDDASITGVHDAQQNRDEVLADASLQTVTRASDLNGNGNGHQFGTRPSTIRRREALRQKVADFVAANPECTVNQLQAVIGGNRQNLLDALTQLRLDGAVTMSRDPSDGRRISYRAAS